MFNPEQHQELFKKNRKKRYGIVLVTPEEGARVIQFTSRNPYRRVLSLLPNRGFSDEVYIVRIAGLEVVAEIPPLIPIPH